MAVIKIPNGSGGWVKFPTIKGDKGDQGEQGPKGDKGDTGPKGDKPAHRWIDTSLQVENPDGTWGDAVNLKGESGEGAGDMLKSIYDPNNKNADAFSMDNMVEGTTNKVFTSAEKTKLAGIETGANKTTIVNNLTETVSGKALDATQGKALADLVSTHTESANPHGTTKADVGLGNVDDVKQMPIAGGTFTGVAVAQANESYTTRQLRNVILSTSDPSGGSNGDIWIKYT